jgi:hypothetical protein
MAVLVVAAIPAHAVGAHVLAGKKASRLGEHKGVVTKALRNSAPSRARRSMCGVWRKGWPAQPMESQR